jgi:hypothetical protein
MNTHNQKILPAVLLALGALALSTCRNPLLSVGLGDKVDITPPGIRLIDSDGVQNGAYVHGTITIQGTSTDDLGVSSVVWAFTDAKSSLASPPAVATLDAAKKNWSFSLNTAQAGALYKDGEKNFVFTVEDGAGKTTETRMMLIFDNGSPVAMVNQPASESDLLNGDVRLSGEAYDPYGVQKVTVRLYDTPTGGSPLNGPDGAVADGTNAWNYSFVSSSLTATSGTFWFEVIVEDRAGNTSSHQYLYPAVFAANANKQVTVDKIAQLEAGDIAAWQDLDASELPGLQKVRQQLSIDQNSDKPQFIISSPVGGDIVGFNSRVVGLITDDDGVANGASDIRVHVWKASGFPDFGWGNAVPAGSGLSVRFSYALNMISTSGDYKLEVQATDINSVTATSPEIIFTVDAGIPAVNITPLARVYFNDNETLHLSGTAQSIGGQVNKVELAIGAVKVLATLASPGAEATAWTCDFALAGITELPTPNKTLVAEATDNHLGAPKVGSTNLFLIIDNTAPQARFVSPTSGSTVYNQVSLRGSTSDNSSLTKVELRLGKAGTGSGDGFVEITGSLYDWVSTFLSNDYANASQSTAGAGSTWVMPIYCRVYDTAGNVATNEPSNPVDPLYPATLAASYGGALTFNPADVPSYSLVIDLDRDKPTITIQTPRDNTNVAGTVVASGSCYDESPGMDTVEIRIEAIRDDDSAIGYVTPDGAAIGSPGWVAVPWIGGQRSYWQDSLNENEKLYNVGAAGGAYPGELLHHGKFHLSVRPTDLGGKAGNIQTVTFRLDDTIPRLESPKLTLNGSDTAAVDYLYARGTIHLKARARDNQQVTSIKLSTNGGSSYGGELIGTGSVTPAAPSDYFDIDYTLDTTGAEIPLALRTAKNGLLTLGVKVQDNATPAPYVNTWFVTLNMDNLYPTGSYTGTSGNGHDPMLLSGNKTSASQVMGTSADGGTVGGINAVEVYLVRGTKVINLATGDLVDKESRLFGETPVSADYTTNPACKAVIDWTRVGAVDGMQLVQNGSDVDWWVKLNTIPITDGAVEIHYATWDRAGNAVHGMQAGFIRNKVPVISSVTVGTDLDASGGVEAGEKSPYNPASPITARNNLLFIKINTTETGYNTPFTYSITNTTPGDAAEYSDATGVASINTAGKFGGDGDGKVFTAKITDAVGIVVQQTVTVNIHNTDSTLPTISVTDIALPADLKDWTNTDLAGHVETAAVSRYNGGDADVSGTVMARGVAHDNVRIDRIQLSIDGGAAATVAHWSGTGLVSDVPALFHISSDTLSDSGHDVSWDYKWDTSAISTTAKNNVILSFVARDLSSNDSAAGTKQYDVVPYITRVDTAITGYISKDFNRSAIGRYPVRAGETVTIKGYNLKPTNTGIGVGTSDVRIVSLANRDTTAKTGRGLVYGSVASPYTSMTATISTVAADASIGSGYLVVWVNGVPSINAISARSNSETNFVSATGTDERWLSVWDLTAFKTAYAAAAPNANHAVYPSMAMNGNTPVFAYVNNVQGYGLAEYWNGAAETKIYENWDLFTYTALGLNTSGSYCSLYDINVVSQGSDFVGDKGGVLTSWFYTPANSAWNNTANNFRDYHIWLDNLYKTANLAVLGRYQYPDMKVTGDNALTRVYYSVYDTIDDRVLVRAFNVGTNAASVGAPANKITDNTTNGAASPNLYTNIVQYRETGGLPTYADAYDAANNRRFGNNNNSGQSPAGAYVVATGAGPWTAVAATSGGVALLVWYDTATNQLKYSYNTAPSVTAGGSWAAAQTLDSFCGGDFVDMAVDSGNHVHIAYHDSYSGDLKYVYIDTYNGAPSVPYVVDSYLTVGNKASISVSSGGVPYITYKGMGNTAKAAWLLGARSDGVDGNEKFTGTWEVQVLPARIVDNDTNRFCMGVDSSTLPVVGYTNDGIEYIRQLADLP